MSSALSPYKTGSVAEAGGGASLVIEARAATSAKAGFKNGLAGAASAAAAAVAILATAAGSACTGAVYTGVGALVAALIAPTFMITQ
jgi:hypothetical protein